VARRAGPCRVQRVVAISAMLISDVPEEVLVTYSLGSCIGVSAWDPLRGQGGLVHCLLPATRPGTVPSEALGEGKYVDTGVAALLQALVNRGSRLADLQIRVAGGARPLKGDAELWAIGERNVNTLRRLLQKNGLSLAAERVGGHEPRTMSLEIATGRVTVRSGGLVEIL
jgi:chemotaxis protein CheD